MNKEKVLSDIITAIELGELVKKSQQDEILTEFLKEGVSSISDITRVVFPKLQNLKDSNSTLQVLKELKSILEDEILKIS